MFPDLMLCSHYICRDCTSFLTIMILKIMCKYSKRESASFLMVAKSLKSFITGFSPFVFSPSFCSTCSYDL